MSTMFRLVNDREPDCPSASLVFHYTNREGYNGIQGTVWSFHARKQRVDKKPYGAYFTRLRPGSSNFVRRLRLPKSKRKFVFAFLDVQDLTELRGDGGEYILYSPTDYEVIRPRQRYFGSVEEWVENTSS